MIGGDRHRLHYLADSFTDNLFLSDMVMVFLIGFLGYFGGLTVGDLWHVKNIYH